VQLPTERGRTNKKFPRGAKIAAPPKIIARCDRLETGRKKRSRFIRRGRRKLPAAPRSHPPSRKNILARVWLRVDNARSLDVSATQWQRGKGRRIGSMRADPIATTLKEAIIYVTQALVSLWGRK
jgi:hypothetical protein